MAVTISPSSQSEEQRKLNGQETKPTRPPNIRQPLSRLKTHKHIDDIKREAQHYQATVAIDDIVSRENISPDAHYCKP